MSYVFSNVQVEDNFTGARSYVRVATTAAGTLATSFADGQTVDGVTLAAGDRILIKNQASGVENGIYIVESVGAPTRASDLETGDAASGIYTWVRSGTVNSNTAYICTNAPGSDDVGTNALVFAQFDVVSELATARGGTGVTSLTSGQVLVGAGTSPVDLTKAAPTGDFVGTSDAQTLSNKTLSAPTVSGDILFDEATNDLTLAVADQITGPATATIPDLGGVSQPLVVTNLAQTLTNKTLTAPILNSVPTLSLDDTDSAFDLTVQSTSTLTADRTFTLDVNDGTRTLSMGGDITTADAFTTTGAFPITLTATGATNVTLPTSGTLANQAYVDSVAQGLDVKESVRLATVDALNDNASISGSITYNATGGASGRGQITATLAVSDTFTVDGVSIGAADDGERILLKNEADTVTAPNGARNGIWTSTISGTSLTLDRAVDFDEDSQVTSGAFTFVEEGTVNVSTGWVLTTPDPITIGGASGTVLTFTLFSASGDVIAGNGLSKTGNQLDVNTSTTIAIVSDNVVVNSTNTANQILLSSGTAGTEAIFGALPLGDANAVTGLLDLANGGTNADLSGATGSRLVQINSGTTAFEVTTAPRVTALTSTADGDNFVTFTDPGTTANFFNISTGATGVAPTLRASGEANTGMIFSDSNSNEVLTLGSVAAAVNDVTVTNAATGVAPTIRSSGEANTGLIFSDSNSNEVLTLGSVAAAVNDVTVTNATTGVAPTVRSSGEANTGLIFSDSNSNEVLTLGSVAAAVNDVAITNSITGVAPTIRASGEANTGMILADSNSNEVLTLSSVAAAVNEMTLTNAATGTSPTLAVTGGDANISLAFQNKGTGVYQFLSTAAVPAEIRLFEDTDLGTNYVGLDVPDVTTSYTLTLPAAVGTTQQVLRLADGSGNLEFATLASATGRVGYSIWSGQISVPSSTASSFAYFAWDQTEYTIYDSPATVIFYHSAIPSNRTLTVDVFDGTSVIGTVTVATSTAAGISTFTITNPIADVRLEFRARRSSPGGASIDIYGMQLEFTHTS